MLRSCKKSPDCYYEGFGNTLIRKVVKVLPLNFKPFNQNHLSECSFVNLSKYVANIRLIYIPAIKFLKKMNLHQIFYPK